MGRKEKILILGATAALFVTLGTLASQNWHPEHTESPKPDSIETHNSTEDHTNTHETPIKITETELIALGGSVAMARSGRLRLGLTLDGEVGLDGDRVAHIIPRFPGIVREIHKQLGDLIRKGDPLALIESNDTLSTYPIKALTGGTIIQKHITLGEVLREDTIVFTVADLASVWIDLQVHQNQLPLIRKGLEVVISATPDIPETTATISYLSPTLNPHSRTAIARIVADNKRNLWRPGSFVRAKLITESVTVPLLVTRQALQTINGQPHIFVKDRDGFLPTQVRLGRSNDTEVEVLSGLEDGQSYVATGSFILKAELGKDLATHIHH